VTSHLVAGTPEAGGWTTREVKRIIRGLAGLNFVYVVSVIHFYISVQCANDSGADIVEVAPAYDTGMLFPGPPIAIR
jgi:agmatinase